MKTIAVDFDGTCVDHCYPEVGKDVPYAVEVLQELVERNNIILFTMRSGKELGDAIDWFKKNNIFLSGINSNPTQTTWTFSNKPYAHIYIDDASFGCPLIEYVSYSRPFVDWLKVKEELISL